MQLAATAPVERSGRDASTFLITHRFPLEESPEGYDLFKNKKEGCVRAVFAP